MASLQQLETALRNADKAGDIDAARRLAQELSRKREQTRQQPIEGSPNALTDIAASGASGLARGTADLVGLPGTIGDALQGGAQWAMRRGWQAATGEAPSPSAGLRDSSAGEPRDLYSDPQVLDAVRGLSQNGSLGGSPLPPSMPPFVERMAAGPTPEIQQEMIGGGGNPLSGGNLRAGLSAISGGATDYQPQTTAGEYSRTIGEFLPGAAVFGGANPSNLLRLGVAPAVTSETAGQLTEGTALEPYARVGGALLGGYAGSRIGRPSSQKLPTAAQIKESAGYKDLKPLMQEARVNQGGYQRAVNELRAVADDFGMVPEQHAAFERILARHSDMASKGGATLQDLEIMRRSLLNAGQQPTNPSAGALSRRLIDKLDEFVNEGAGLTGQALREARQVYRTGAKAATIEEAISKAQNTASGFENGLRVEFRKLLNNKKYANQWTDIERSAMEQVVQGNFTSNALRWLGGFGVPLDNGRNFLGSVIGGSVGASAGAAVGGPVGAAIGGPLLMGVGTAAKAGSNAATRNAATIAEALIKSGPQGAQMFGDALLANQGAGREALVRALLQGQSAAQVPGARVYAQ